jgi:cyclopropane fatty-acyl-phospholipid synthase-like methyltransferase
MLYAAEKYGVEAVGITLSQPQADLAMKRIQEHRDV